MTKLEKSNIERAYFLKKVFGHNNQLLSSLVLKREKMLSFLLGTAPILVKQKIKLNIKKYNKISGIKPD